MPDKLLDAEDLTSASADVPRSRRLPDDAWLPVLQHPCDFAPNIFDTVSLNLIQNPNINSSILFRADILYDSNSNELTNAPITQQEWAEALHTYNLGNGDFPELQGFDVKRTILRRMIPRNPQLDKPILQTCLLLSSEGRRDGSNQKIVVYIPHAAKSADLPWYLPRVQALAYLHSWANPPPEKGSQGMVSLHYRLYPTDKLPLDVRLSRTGLHLLTTLYKHGQGVSSGYEKRVHHDQLVSQQRVQNTYTELKIKHAKRLTDNWAEQTEPSKHVFEDLGIAAFLVELWKDMYRPAKIPETNGKADYKDERPLFPGFVDIGCGNGVLVDVLLREGYQGWGFDARKRKTWSTFVSGTKKHLKEMTLIPQPLFELHTQASKHPNSANGSLLSYLPPTIHPNGTKYNYDSPDQPTWNNGIFSPGTFIISNHADELTPWTPLLASVSASPFLAIPCCSHNLSGSRFRAPSVFNNHSADALAPSYFAKDVSRSKSVAIGLSSPDSNFGMEEIDEAGPEGHDGPLKDGKLDEKLETGDLTKQSQAARAKQPSAYSSLCDWISHLSARVGYVVEKEALRLPSTRNIGIIGRGWTEEFAGEPLEIRMRRVMEIAKTEKADGIAWVGRANGLGGKNSEH